MNRYKKYNNVPTNGFGERIYNPRAYYKAVSEDKYGYSSSNNSNYNRGWNDGYSQGYADGYEDSNGGW